MLQADAFLHSMAHRRGSLRKVDLKQRAVAVKASRKGLRGAGGAGQEKLVDQLMARGRRFATLPVLDPGNPDDIAGYDEAGVPR